MGCISSKNKTVGAPNTKAAALITKVKEAWGTTMTEVTSWPIVAPTTHVPLIPHAHLQPSIDQLGCATTGGWLSLHNSIYILIHHAMT